MTSGTEGRIYGGDPNLLHIPDGTREEFAINVANNIVNDIREINNGRTDPPCPGCCNVVVFNIARELARQSGQTETEMARSLIKAFEEIAGGTKASYEEIEIILDPC